jgi:hypothetical protein
VAQVGWVLDYLDDIVSDFSVFHRVDDITALDGPSFFRMAWRLAAYTGVMQARANAEQQDEPAPAAPGSAPSSRQQRDVNPGTQTTLQADPAFAGIFSFDQAGS